MDLTRQAVVQAAMVFDELVHHPRCSRTTDHQQDVMPPGSPAVPESLQSGNEIRFGSVHPWKFVQKNNFAPFFRRQQKAYQTFKSLLPVFKSAWRNSSSPDKGIAEILQLHRFVAVRQS